MVTTEEGDMAAWAGISSGPSTDMSPEIAELAAALAKAQGMLEPASMDSENEAFKRGAKVSRYADLAAIIEACRVPLSSNGLAFVQLPYRRGNTVGVITRLLHCSGQWIQCDLSIEVQTPDGHKTGAGTTYCRRFGLQSLVGVAAEPDDDGNSVSTVKPAPNRDPFGPVPVKGVAQPPPTKPAPVSQSAAVAAAVEAFGGGTVVPADTIYCSEGQRRSLQAAMKKGNHTRDASKAFLATMHGIESTTQIPAHLYNQLALRFADPEPFPGE